MLRGGLILSGGPDSAVAAWSAVKQLPDANWHGFHFTYGQMAKPERECASYQAKLLGVPLHIIPLASGILTSEMTDVQEVRAADGLEPTFVPGRNDIFLSLVAARLYRGNDPLVIVGGWNEDDSSGYPDCREEFIQAKEKSLSLALQTTVSIQSPVIHLRKGEIIKLASLLGVPLEHTWSCYKPVLIRDESTNRLDWKACRQCVSCLLRAKGFKEANMEDPVD